MLKSNLVDITQRQRSREERGRRHCVQHHHATILIESCKHLLQSDQQLSAQSLSYFAECQLSRIASTNQLQRQRQMPKKKKNLKSQTFDTEHALIAWRVDNARDMTWSKKLEICAGTKSDSDAADVGLRASASAPLSSSRVTVAQLQKNGEKE